MTRELLSAQDEKVVQLFGVAPLLSDEQVAFESHSGGNGGGGSMDDVVRRVSTLEKTVDKLDGKIDKLTELVNAFGLKTSERLGGVENRLTAIETKLDTKAAKTDLTAIETKLGTLDGKVSGLPGVGAMITLVLSAVALSLGGAAALAFTLFRMSGRIPS